MVIHRRRKVNKPGRGGRGRKCSGREYKTGRGEGGGGGGAFFIADFFLRSNVIIARFRYTCRYKTACTFDIDVSDACRKFLLHVSITKMLHNMSQFLFSLAAMKSWSYSGQLDCTSHLLVTME